MGKKSSRRPWYILLLCTIHPRYSSSTFYFSTESQNFHLIFSIRKNKSPFSVSREAACGHVTKFWPPRWKQKRYMQVLSCDFKAETFLVPLPMLPVKMKTSSLSSWTVKIMCEKAERKKECESPELCGRRLPQMPWSEINFLFSQLLFGIPPCARRNPTLACQSYCRRIWRSSTDMAL